MKWGTEPRRTCILSIPDDVWQLHRLQGDEPPEVVFGAECALYGSCPMRKGDGTCWCWQARREDG